MEDPSAGEFEDSEEALEANMAAQGDTPAPETTSAVETGGKSSDEARQSKLAESDAGNIDPEKTIEAALFLANRPMPFAELAIIAHCTVKKAMSVVGKLAEKYDSCDLAVQILVNNGAANLQVRQAYLGPVAALSKQTEMTRKGSRMLALIAKKGTLLQSELKRYFRGEIYAYISELKELGYVISEKKGNTRLLKVTEKFRETFQMADSVTE